MLVQVRAQLTQHRPERFQRCFHLVMAVVMRYRRQDRSDGFLRTLPSALGVEEIHCTTRLLQRQLIWLPIPETTNENPSDGSTGNVLFVDLDPPLKYRKEWRPSLFNLINCHVDDRLLEGGGSMLFLGGSRVGVPRATGSIRLGKRETP